jgi:type II secretory pathway pseudopilin PulG
MNRKLTDQTKSGKGFTIVELLIAIVIFMIITGAIYGLLDMGRGQHNQASRRTDVLKNVRSAVHLIGRDALNAGLGYHQNGAIVPDNFLSEILEFPADADSERDILTAVVAGNDLFTNDFQADTNERTDSIAFAFRDLDFNDGRTIDLKDVKPGTGATAVRLELDKSETTHIKPFDMVLVEAGSTQVAAIVTSVVDNKNIDLETADPLQINLPRDAAGINGSLLKKCEPPTLIEHCVTEVSSLKRIFWVSYRVKQDGTLVRIVYGNHTGNPSNQQIIEQPLAYNVKDLQFQYVLADGTITDNPLAGPDGDVGTEDDRPNDFNLIRQVKINIEVQSTTLDEKTGKPEMIKLDAIFSLRNLQYDIG